jgi:hypothetical protein
MAMSVIWVFLGLTVMIVLLAILERITGRGHLGAEQSQSHYLDEVDVYAHFPHG